MYAKLKDKFDAPPLVPAKLVPKICQSRAAESRPLKKGYMNFHSESGWHRKYFVLTRDFFRYRHSPDRRIQGEFKFNKNMFFMVQPLGSGRAMNNELLAIGAKDAQHVFQMQSWLTSWVR